MDDRKLRLRQKLKRILPRYLFLFGLLAAFYFFRQYPIYKGTAFENFSKANSWSKVDHYTFGLAFFFFIGLFLWHLFRPENFEYTNNTLIIRRLLLGKLIIDIKEIAAVYQKEHPFDRSYILLKNGKKHSIPSDMDDSKEFKQLILELNLPLR